MDTLENSCVENQLCKYQLFVVVTWSRPPDFKVGIFSTLKDLTQFNSENTEYYLT